MKDIIRINNEKVFSNKLNSRAQFINYGNIDTSLYSLNDDIKEKKRQLKSIKFLLFQVKLFKLGFKIVFNNTHFDFNKEFLNEDVANDYFGQYISLHDLLLFNSKNEFSELTEKDIYRYYEYGDITFICSEISIKELSGLRNRIKNEIAQLKKKVISLNSRTPLKEVTFNILRRYYSYSSGDEDNIIEVKNDTGATCKQTFYFNNLFLNHEKTTARIHCRETTRYITWAA